jgi:hypothetical protein
MDTDHEQVPFTTFDGELTEVDVGMFDVLTRLKEMGVRTQFSCQGGEDLQPAYVAADARSFMPIVRAIRKQLRWRNYSSEALNVARLLMYGGLKREVNFLVDKREDTYLYTFHIRFKKKRSGFFSIEDVYSNRFGHRIVFRWPAEFTDDILKMLYETHI